LCSLQKLLFNVYQSFYCLFHPVYSKISFAVLVLWRKALPLVGQKLLSNSGLWAFVSPVSTRGTSCTCLSITSNMNNVIHTSLWDDSFDISEICQCFVISSSIHWVLNSSLTVTRHWTPSYKPNFSSFTIYLHPWDNGAQCSTTQLSLYTTSIGWWIWLGVIHSVMAHRLICTDSCTAYHSISPKTAKRTPLPFPHTT